MHMQQSHATNTRRPRALLALAAVLCCLLLAIVSANATVQATSPERLQREASLFSSKVLRFNTVQELQATVSRKSMPLLYVIFDGSIEQHVESFWVPLINELCEHLESIGISVAYLRSDSSKDAEAIEQNGLPMTTAILLLNGILRITARPDGQPVFYKIPLSYSDRVEVGPILRWVLANIDPRLIERIESEDDLADIFSLYPVYPQLPRVLYFSSTNYVAPAVRVCSQQLLGDVVIGALVDVFASEATAAIARRYNITKQDDLPAMLVLRGVNGGDGEADEAQKIEGITGATTFTELRALLKQALPESSENVLLRSLSSGERHAQQEMIAMLEKRKMYVLQQLEEEKRRLDESLVDALLPKPTLVATQKEWEVNCLRLDSGYQCLITFVASTGKDSLEAEVQKVTAVVHPALKRIHKEFPDVKPELLKPVVVDCTSSPRLCEYFDAGEKGFPSVTLLTMSRPRRYSTNAGSFTEDGVVSFYINYGDKRTIDKLGAPFYPKLVPGIGARDTDGDRDEEDRDL